MVLDLLYALDSLVCFLGSPVERPGNSYVLVLGNFHSIGP